MPRRPFGGGPNDVVVDPATGRPIPGATGTAWSTRTGGSQYADLQDADGNPLGSGLVTADAQGRVRLLGPDDGTAAMWMDFGYGRFLLLATDIDDRMDAAESSLTALAGTQSTLDGRVSVLEGKLGAPGGVATLGADGIVPYTQLPPLGTGAAVLDDLTDVSTTGADAPAPGQVLTWDGSLWRPSWPGPRAALSTLTLPIVVAQEGGWMDAPRNSLESALLNAACGIGHESLCAITADGVPMAIDATLGQQTILTGNTADVYANALMRAGVMDSSAWFGSGWADEPVATVDQILTAIGGRVPVILTYSGVATATALAQLVTRHNCQPSTILCSGSLAELAPAVTAGISAMLNAGNGTGVDAGATLAAGVQWVRLTSPTTTTVDTLVAAGLRVAVQNVERHRDRTTWVTHSAQILLSATPRYSTADPARYRAAQDPFLGGTWPPGFVPRSNADSRGTFPGGGLWRPPIGSAAYIPYTLQGWACPLPNPNSWTMDFDVTWENVGPGGGGNFLMMVVCSPDDQPFSGGGATTSSGYQARARFDGALQLARSINGTTTVGPSVSTPAPASGQTISYRLTVTGSAITLSRPDAAPPNSVTWAETSLRGGYWHIGVLGVAPQSLALSNIVIT